MADAVKILTEAMRQRKSSAELALFLMDRKRMEALLREVCGEEPRLTGCLSSWSAVPVRKKGLLKLEQPYQIQLCYAPEVPSCGEITEDDGRVLPSALVRDGHEPWKFCFVTRDADALGRRIQEDLERDFAEVCPDVRGFQVNTMTCSYSDYTLLFLEYDYPVLGEQYRMMTTMAAREAESICRSRFACAPESGPPKLPALLRAFLAFSYLQQNCSFHERADETRGTDSPVDPWADMAYGPLCRRMGTAVGIAQAYRLLLQSLGVECRLIRGGVPESGGERLTGHTWCLVQIDGNFYHVDPTFAVDQAGVFVEAFMQSDRGMSGLYVWDLDRYPRCSYSSPNYSQVAAYVRANYSALTAAGVDAQYFDGSCVVD